jgi:hypothetical protein
MVAPSTSTHSPSFSCDNILPRGMPNASLASTSSFPTFVGSFIWRGDKHKGKNKNKNKNIQKILRQTILLILFAYNIISISSLPTFVGSFAEGMKKNVSNIFT